MTTTTDGTNLWIRRFNPVSEPAVRLVCLPHAGGAASFFLPVSRALAPNCDVLAVQYPGRQDRRTEKCIDNIPELADAVTEQLLTWTDRPLAVFGHSLGATLGFEVAQRLEQRGTEVTALFVSGRRAPSRHRDESVHLLSDEGLIRELKTLNGTGLAVLDDDEILRMSLPALRGDYTAAETYRYTECPPLRTPIYAHIGNADPRVNREEAEAWSLHTTASFELHAYPGGHFYLNDQTAHLVASIKQVLLPATPSIHHPRP
ncbi:alpha/beta fold hydrolase [Nocardia sp. NPDC046473]|uniref:thioesterase II family protein n=1 Tax=Nocardia sp. NPDC046473 TaxID=3155733 RepID=UPI00340547CA